MRAASNPPPDGDGDGGGGARAEAVVASLAVVHPHEIPPVMSAASTPLSSRWRWRLFPDPGRAATGPRRLLLSGVPARSVARHRFIAGLAAASSPAAPCRGMPHPPRPRRGSVAGPAILPGGGYSIAVRGGFGSYLLALNKKIYEMAGEESEGNVPGSYKEPGIAWMIGFLLAVSFVGLLSLVPLRKGKVRRFFFDFSLTYVGAGMICSHLVNLSLLLGAILSWGVMWPLISDLQGSEQEISKPAHRDQTAARIYDTFISQ